MKLFRYNVTRIRAAACCPRIHYFDAEEGRRKNLKARPLTRIWTEAEDSEPGGGKIFHTVVERFNSVAGKSERVASAVAGAESPADLHRALMRFINAECLDHDKLKTKSVALRQNFVRALDEYVNRVSTTIFLAVSSGGETKSVLTRLFGDGRKRVDTTFHVCDDARVHVTGTIDYVYEDPQTGQNRIVDYKLTPPAHPNKDMMQVMVYALMHHHQHGTKPAAVVHYLHPTRQLLESSWEQVRAQRAKVYDLLASMTQWESYDEGSGRGLKPMGDLTYCSACKWSRQCEARLGPKSEGGWDHRWATLTSSAGHDLEPKSVAHQPPVAIAPGDLVEGCIAPAEEGAETPDGPEPGFQKTLPSAGVHPRPVVLQAPEGLGGAAPSPFSPPVPVREPRITPGPGPSAPPAIVAPPVAPVESPPPANKPRLNLGETVKGISQAVTMDPEVLNTHVAVVGAAGSGKTWMAKVIAEEAILAGVPVLAIDPQGDLVQFLHQRENDAVPPEHRRRYEAFRRLAEPRIFTPGSSHATRLRLDPVRLPSAADLARIADPQRRKEEHEAMVSAVASNLVALAKAGGEVDSQRNFLFQLLLSISGEVSLDRIVEGLREPDQFGIEDADQFVKKVEREKLARKLHGYLRGPSAALFQGGVPLDLDLLRAPTTPGKVPLNVIYLNALADDDQKQFFVASLAAEVYRYMVTSLDATGGRPNLLFYLDEARDFIPAGTKRPPAKDALIRLFTQGRKYGVGCLLCTQSPRSVDYSVFGNCSTKVIGRMEATQDIERIEEWFSTSGAVPSWVAHRKGAERGTFVARWPNMPNEMSGKAFRSRILFSAHEGAWSPERLEKEMAHRH